MSEPKLVVNRSSQSSRSPADTSKSLPCFKHGCDFRAHHMSLVLRHAKTVHKLNYCRDCCIFYDDVRSKYCPHCQLFCMSPMCFHAAPMGTNINIALSQRHRRTSLCPSIWGRTSGVPDAQLLDYLRRLDEDSHKVNATRDESEVADSSMNNALDAQKNSSERTNTNVDGPLCPLEHCHASTFPTSDTASYPTTSVSNSFARTENNHRTTDRTATPWPEPSNNAGMTQDNAFGFLCDDPTTWIWDGIVR